LIEQANDCYVNNSTQTILSVKDDFLHWHQAWWAGESNVVMSSGGIVFQTVAM